MPARKRKPVDDLIVPVNAAPGFQQSGYLTSITSNLALGEGRPETISLGRKATVLYGDNGSGKSRWIYALGLLLNGAVDDFQGRSEPVKATKELAWLLPKSLGESNLRVSATLMLPSEQTGELEPAEVSYIAKVAGTAGAPDRSVPALLRQEGAIWSQYIAPVRMVNDLLTGDVAATRAKLLPLITQTNSDTLSTLVPSTYRTIPGGMEVLEVVDVGDLVRGLDTVQTRHKQYKDEIKALSRQIEDYDTSPDRVDPPSLEDIANLERQFNVLTDQIGQLQTVEEIHNLRDAGYRVKEQATEVQQRLEALRGAAPGEFTQSPPSPPNERVLRLRDLLRQGAQIRKEVEALGLTFCPLTGRSWEVTDLGSLKTKYEKASALLTGYEKEMSAYREAQRAHEATQRDHAQRVRSLEAQKDQHTGRLDTIRSSLTRLKSNFPDAWDIATQQVENAEKGDGIDNPLYADAKRKLGECETALSDARYRRRIFDEHNTRRERLAAMQEEGGWFTRSEGVWKKAIKTCLESGSKGFCASASKYLPAGYHLELALEEDGRQTFRVGLTRPDRADPTKTITTFALSGIQHTLAVFALSCALIDRLPGGRPPLVVLWPHEERSWSAKSLGEFLNAISTVPNCPQVILPSTTFPVGLKDAMDIEIIDVATGGRMVQPVRVLNAGLNEGEVEAGSTGIEVDSAVDTATDVVGSPLPMGKAAIGLDMLLADFMGVMDEE